MSYLNVTDSNGSQWSEVPYLAQETIFDAQTNVEANDPELYQYNETTPYLLKIKKNTKVGLSFSPPSSIKKIIQKSNNKNINCLILDKFYLKNKNIQKLKIKKYFYTIKTKSEFNKYNKKNNLIFENL
mgnify:CR=1 FL=1